MKLNLGNSEQRVKLLKAGFSGKEIEKLYIEQNNFKIVYNILYEGNELNVHQNNNHNFTGSDVNVEFSSPIYRINKKTKSILRFGVVGLSLILLVPISTIFLALFLTFLFVPPMFAFFMILHEGIPIISEELNKLPYNFFIPNTCRY